MIENRNSIGGVLLKLQEMINNSNSFDKDEFKKQINSLLSLSAGGNLGEEVMKLINIVSMEGTGDHFYRQLIRMLSLIDSIDKKYKSIIDTFSSDYKSSKVDKGIPFLCSAIDDLTGGISEGELCTILGASGSMKTTYSSNIAYNALKMGKNVLYLSLEELPIQLYSKWLSRASVDVGKPLETQKIIRHKLDEKDIDVLFNEIEPYFSGLEGKLYIVGEQDLWDYSLQSIEDKFREVDILAKERTGHGIDLLVVDHIQLIKFAVTDMNETSVINMYVSFFRQQCLSWLHEDRSIAVILLSQANREGVTYASKHEGTYLATHVAEASEIIRASSYIISVYTDPLMQVSKLLALGCVKLRGAQLPIGTINVYADGSLYQVGDNFFSSTPNYSMNDLMNTEIENKKEFDLEALYASEIFEGI